MSYTVIITEEISANVDITTQNYPITIEYNATNIQSGGSYGNANVVSLLSSYGSNTISTTGNVSAGYFQGNGSLLTNLPPGNYSNANVSAFLAAFGSNVISTTGNITGGNFVGNGQALTSITGANVTGTVANATYALTANASTFSANATYALNANAATYATNAIQANVSNVANSVAGANVSGTVGLAQYVTQAAQGNITSVGTLTALIVNGNATVGNLLVNTDTVITGNLTVNGTTTTINSNTVTTNDLAIVLANNQSTSANVNGAGIIAGTPAVASLLYNDANAAWQSNVDIRSPAYVASGNITGGNLITAGIVYTPQVEAAGDLDLNVAGKVNVNGNLRVGDNNTDTQISTHGNANLTLKTDNANSSSVIVRWGTNANIDLVPHGTGQTNITGAVSASGNITGSNIIGNGQYLTNLPAANVSGTVANAAYATSAGSASTANTVTDAAQANITSVGTLTSLSVSGNVVAANLVATANISSRQQTVIGTANVGTTGNIVISGKNIATDMAWSPDGGNAATAATGRIVVGTGWAGNITHSAQQNRMSVSDAFNRSNTSTSVRHFAVESFVNVTGNVVQNGFRQQGLGSFIRIGGGSAANTISSSGAGTTGVPLMLSGGQFNLDVGDYSPYLLGNTTVSHAAINGGALQLAGNSRVGNAYGIYNFIGNVNAVTTPGTYGNIVGYSTSMTPPSAPTGNVYGFFHASNVGAHNIQTNNSARQAPQYYAFYNQDDHAHVQAGSLRSYHEYRGDLATTGTVNIDKVNGQTQYIRPTGNVTIGTFSNFVTETTDGSTYDQHIDTVTIVIAQGSTPYTITMPTGNSSIKYAGGTSTVGATANAVSMISISAANINSVKTYMVTISPEFT